MCILHSPLGRPYLTNFPFQIVIPDKFPLQINVVIKNTSAATQISGLAGNGFNGEYTMRNGSTVTNTSKESDMFDFGETCKNTCLILSLLI